MVEGEERVRGWKAWEEQATLPKDCSEISDEKKR